MESVNVLRGLTKIIFPTNVQAVDMELIQVPSGAPVWILQRFSTGIITVSRAGEEISSVFMFSEIRDDLRKDVHECCSIETPRFNRLQRQTPQGL